MPTPKPSPAPPRPTLASTCRAANVPTSPQPVLTGTKPSEADLRASLGDDAIWDTLTADPQTRSQTEAWIKTRRASIEAQLISAREQFEGSFIMLRGNPEDPEYQNTRSRYEDWRKRALSMKVLCEKRLSQLKQRWIETNTRIDAYAELVRSLGQAIADHEHDFTVSERTRSTQEKKLWALLDELVLPGDDQFTVRDLVELQP